MAASSRLPEVSAVDRLTSLPDDILHAIMAFLLARQAVQTCVLSRRWEDLWSSMPCLNIDQQEFGTATSAELEGASGRFEEFVNSLLMFHRAPSLDTFRFRVNESYKSGVATRWLRRGLKCCPAVLEISLSARAPYLRLPHLGSSACRLKMLHLVKVSLDKVFTEHLPCGCPVLEDLKLDKCYLDSPEITSCTLKNLIVTDCTSDYGKVLSITAPNIVSFHLIITDVGAKWSDILVNEMPSLAKATICLKQHKPIITSLKGPYKLLCSLTNVRYLKLSGSNTLSLLNGRPATFPTFPNIKTLLLDGCDMSDDFRMLGCFLSSAPSLEKLTLQHCKLPEGSKKRKRMDSPKRISIKCPDTLTFQCTNLKLTEIKYKEDDIHQLFGLLSGIWRNLRKSTIVLTKD
ncbi:hypothetical protein U9M48_025912 [Paspalum notatum var. saurae]|uniref:F-box domain-containing protein n=1 Tax=Paspalum notatum var. saurae TaxID=547442 RepID=A0AAQ3TRR6_PASNO